MYIDIKHVLARYGTRRLFNTHKPHVELGRMPVAYYPHRSVSMDLVDPFPTSRRGHSYMFALIDHLSLLAYPIAHKIVAQLTTPEILISHHGMELCNFCFTDAHILSLTMDFQLLQQKVGRNLINYLISINI